MLMMLTMMTIIPHLMADGKEDEVDDEEDDLVAEQDVGHEGDQGKPGGGKTFNLSCVVGRLTLAAMATMT